MGAKKSSGGQRRYQTSREKKKQNECSPVKVQVLYKTCKEVFEDCGPGIIPSAENIQRIKDVMDGMTEADVGLRSGMQIFRTQGRVKLPSISYIRIYECDKFSIGLFCLPASAVIPLHNHPEMTVFCKLLFGRMYVNSFDWVNADSPNEDGVFSAGPSRTVNSVRPGSDFNANSADEVVPAGVLRLAKTKADHEITAPCNTSVIYPADGGNLHTFTAVTPCAFLDVLGPPYSNPEGRQCTFYRKYSFSTITADGKISMPEEQSKDFAWLEETEEREGSLVYAQMYTGPEIIPE